MQGNLNDDILMEIFSRTELAFEDILQISLASHRFRLLVLPTIFSKHTWSPWRGICRAFPPSSLWPHIRTLEIQGPYMRRPLLDSARREHLVSQLGLAAQCMTAADKFIITDISGGLWPELLEAISFAAPALSHLVLLDSPWLGVDQDIFDLPPTLQMPPLRSLMYHSPHAPAASSNGGWVTSRRPLHQLESEIENLFHVLQASYSSLETLEIPGELLLYIKPSLDWNSLRELYIQGLWPNPTDVTLLSMLSMMRNLRVASLQFHPSHRGESFYVVPGAVPELLLPQLQRFEIASLSPEDHILSALPSGLGRLAVIEYPPSRDLFHHPAYLLKSSAFLQVLTGVYLPAVTHLELWYMADASDEQFLRSLPHKFPSVRYLEIRRFTSIEMRNDPWNPTPILKDVLGEMKHLRVFVLEMDTPQRQFQRPPRGISPNYARYIRSLKALAEECVSLAPWVEQIRMWVGIDDSHFWKPWDVVAVPGERVRLRPLASKEDMPLPELQCPPYITAIMEEGPVEPLDAEWDWQ